VAMALLAPALVGILLLTLSPPRVGASEMQRRPWVSAAAGTFPRWEGQRDVTYCTDGGQPLTMALFAPTPSDRPAPVVLQVHGGGWERGERFIDLAQSPTAVQLAERGMVVASINYRLAPENPWPDQIIDVKCAVRFLRANALELGIDPDRIAAWGSSAGGQLVSLLGVGDTPAAWDAGAYGDVSSRVDAVVDEFGPADLSATGWGAYITKIFRTVFGSDSASSPVLHQASPINYVGPGDPPFLILQGTADRIVPAAQSEKLAERLEADQVPTELVLVARGAHGLGTPGEDPSPAQIEARIVSFLSEASGFERNPA
jgi:acetyl esterase/lipase